jgi:hypothetical protein
MIQAIVPELIYNPQHLLALVFKAELQWEGCVVCARLVLAQRLRRMAHAAEQAIVING